MNIENSGVVIVALEFMPFFTAAERKAPCWMRARDVAAFRF